MAIVRATLEQVQNDAHKIAVRNGVAPNLSFTQVGAVLRDQTCVCVFYVIFFPCPCNLASMISKGRRSYQNRYLLCFFWACHQRLCAAKQPLSHSQMSDSHPALASVWPPLFAHIKSWDPQHPQWVCASYPDMGTRSGMFSASSSQL